MKIIITGGTGFIGTSLSAALERGNHHITVLARHEPKMLVDFVKCDLVKDAFTPEMVRGQDAIVHLAGVPVFTRWSNHYKQLILQSRVESAKKLVDAVLALPKSDRTSVVVSASAIGYYGERGETELTEESAAGSGFLAQVCVAWEQVWEPLRDAGIRVVCIRTGVVIDGNGGMLGALLPSFRLGLGPIIGDGSAYLSWISKIDLIRIYTLAVEDRSLSGPINAVSPQAVTYRELAKTIGRIVKRPVLVPSPIWLMDIALNGSAKEGFASAKVRPNKLLQLGYTFIVPNVSQAVERAL